MGAYLRGGRCFTPFAIRLGVCVFFVRLNEGLEAMDMLKFGRPGEVNEESEISKMWTSSFRPVRSRGRGPVSTQACFFRMRAMCTWG